MFGINPPPFTARRSLINEHILPYEIKSIKQSSKECGHEYIF